MGRSGGEAVRWRPEGGQAIERSSYLLSLCPRSFRSTRRSFPPGHWDALQPHAENAVYVNYLGPDDGEDRIREAYGDEHYARLKALKRVYDPANVFRNNQNISPD